MKDFNSISRQRALSLVSYLQRYDYVIELIMYSCGDCSVCIYLDTLEEAKALKKSLGVFLDSSSEAHITKVSTFNKILQINFHE